MLPRKPGWLGPYFASTLSSRLLSSARLPGLAWSSTITLIDASFSVDMDYSCGKLDLICNALGYDANHRLGWIRSVGTIRVPFLIRIISSSFVRRAILLYL